MKWNSVFSVRKPLSMNPVAGDPFAVLFIAVCQKCFNSRLTAPLSEAESRHLSNEILEKTGLVIGAKSLKNYSFYVSGHAAGKTENPSVATLDTFARYVLNGPYTSETARKKDESHFPYWFRFKSTLADEQIMIESAGHAGKPRPAGRTGAGYSGSLRWWLLVAFLAISFALWFLAGQKKPEDSFADHFQNVSQDSLKVNGWELNRKRDSQWNVRDITPGLLTLFTLPGDNWADSAGRQGISNLLYRRIGMDCFSTEIHLNEFFPGHNWQQAGLLLMEDGPEKGRSLRVSLAYNGFFGGYKKDPEIYLQAIVSNSEDAGKPEEMLHLPLFSLSAAEKEIARNNMRHAAIRIEKTGDHFRILYAAGPVENFAFKEAITREIDLKPRYIGLFAIEGFVPDTDYLPVGFSFFGLKPKDCK